MSNPYKDEKGHWTTKENDGGKCKHEGSSGDENKPKRWNDVYHEFVENPSQAEKIFYNHKDDPAYKEAFKRWNNFSEEYNYDNPKTPYDVKKESRKEVMLPHNNEFYEKEPDVETWNDAYKEFVDIVNNNSNNISSINRKVDELYKKHKGDPAWDEAYERWNENSDEEPFDDDYDFDKWDMPEGDTPESDELIDSEELMKENYDIGEEERENIKRDSKLGALKDRLNNNYLSIETDALRKLSDKDIEELNSKLDELESILKRSKR